MQPTITSKQGAFFDVSLLILMYKNSQSLPLYSATVLEWIIIILIVAEIAIEGFRGWREMTLGIGGL